MNVVLLVPLGGLLLGLALLYGLVYIASQAVLGWGLGRLHARRKAERERWPACVFCGEPRREQRRANLSLGLLSRY